MAADPDGRALYIGSRDRIETIEVASGASAVWPALGERAVITSLAVSDTRIYAADAGNRIVHCFAPDGRRVGEVGGKDPERGAPGLVVPSPCLDVVLGPGASVWVVNPGRRSIEKYGSDGVFASSWSPEDIELAGFCGCCNPTHIALRPDGSLVTSEKGIVRVKLFGPAGDFMGVVAGPSRFADDEDNLDLAVFSDGRILVLVPGQSELRLYEISD